MGKEVHDGREFLIRDANCKLFQWGGQKMENMSSSDDTGENGKEVVRVAVRL